MRLYFKHDAEKNLADTTLGERMRILRNAGPLVRYFSEMRIDQITKRENVEGAGRKPTAGKNDVDALGAVLGIGHRNVKDLRDTFASQLLTAGVQLGTSRRSSATRTSR